MSDRECHIIVASRNPVKLAAAEAGFTRMFPSLPCRISGVSAPSGVSDQPMTSRETLQGALNRARSVRKLVPEADFWMGIEGGVQTDPEGDLTSGELWAFAWVAVLGPGSFVGRGHTGAFPLPPAVAALVHEGKELGEADDIVFGRSNSKQENGAVGLLTDNVMDRAGFYAHAVTLALIPFKNPDLYRNRDQDAL